jgi:hypothetical protein
MAGTRTRGQDDQAIIDLAFRMALARVGSPRMEGTGAGSFRGSNEAS